MNKEVVLALGAHPDDIELGCAGTLLLHKLRSDKVYLLILTRGEASGNPQIREAECRKSAEILNIDDLFFGGLPDTKVHDDRETINVIEKVINEVKPDMIYAPTSKDTHQDHRNAGLAIMAAGRRCRRILLYEGASTLRDFYPQVFVDIQRTFEKKMQAVSVFGSQMNQGGAFFQAMKAIEGLAKFRGYQARVDVAEAFEVGKYILEI